MARITLNDLILPTSTARHIGLQCVSEPDERQQIRINRLGLKVPRRIGEPHWKKQLDVVPKSQ